MKNQIRGLLVALLFVNCLLATAFGADKPVKLAVIRPPAKYVLDTTLVRTDEVLYKFSAEKDGVHGDFVAGHDGTLRSLRLVMGDQTVYTWDCKSQGGKVITDDTEENGVHLDNKVAVDRAKWLAFFKREVSLRPFELETREYFQVYSKTLEYVGHSDTSPTLYHYKVEGTERVISLNPRAFLVAPPGGKFQLGMIGDRFIPLVREGEGWKIVTSQHGLVAVDDPPPSLAKAKQ